MALITAVLAAVFVSSILSMQQTLEDLSQQILLRVLQEGGRNRPDTGISIQGDRVVLPYFTVEVWGERAYVTGGTYANLDNTQELTEILQDCLSQDAPQGTVSAYHLRYLRRDNGLFFKLAFVDMSMEQALLRQMAGRYLLIGLGALGLLFAVSMILSRWATRPVEQAWQQQRQFLSDASHELKTPLTVILSNAELLGAVPLEDRPARWVDNIDSEARQMRALVEKMLTLARSDAMTQNTPLEPLSLTDLADSCALAFEPVAFEAGKPLDYTLCQELWVMGSAERLRQLLSILLDNAIKYGAEGAPITLTLERSDRHALLTVANQGPPIPPEKLPHLFERFYRADESRGEVGGFGLGLSIADAIARDHRGTLQVQSDERSTRFTFSIPLRK